MSNPPYPDYQGNPGVVPNSPINQQPQQTQVITTTHHVMGMTFTYRKILPKNQKFSL